jgi:hypothetical protein
MFETFL